MVTRRGIQGKVSKTRDAGRRTISAELFGRHYWASPLLLAQAINHRVVSTPALELIDSALTNLANTPDGRLIVTMPPQEGKSYLIAGDFPAWALTRNPDWRIVAASYGADLATRNGRAIRRRMSSPEIDMPLSSENASVSDWTLDGHTGGVFAVGIGGGVTGRAADLLIIDDPIKSRQEAESKLIRDRIWDWWTDEASARLAPGAPVVVVMTRWHEDDLAGRLLQRDTDAGWRLLNIPAQCENPDTDPLGRQAGEYMLSARGRTVEQWEQRKTTAGSRAWNALYQGRPAPAEGGMFKREWWKTWHDQPPLTQVFMSWDMAFKGTTTSDFVVGQVWALDGANAYLLDQARGRWTFTETLAQFRLLCERWPMATAKLVEDKANGTAVIDMLRREIPGIIPVEPQGGKEARAAAVSPLVEAGNVHLPDTRWAKDLIEEAATFPNSPNDDQVDALTQALAKAKISMQKTRRVGGSMFNIG